MLVRSGITTNFRSKTGSFRVSTTPGNPGNLLEFVWSSWKCKMSMIDCIGFQSWWNWVPDRLFKKLVALFIFATAPMFCISCFCSIFRQTSRFGTLHSRPKQCKHVLDFSWNPSWNLLEICSVKFVDTLSLSTCECLHVPCFQLAKCAFCTKCSVC